MQSALNRMAELQTELDTNDATGVERKVDKVLGAMGFTADDHSLPVSAFSLCAENHHAFVGTEDGGLCILANPIVNIQVLEAIAGELLNL